MTIDCVREALANEDVTWPLGMGEQSAGTPAEALLVAGIQSASAHLFSLAQRNVDMAGMGTTFSGLVVLDDRVVIAHIGDTRVYRLRGDELTQLTTDHSALEDAIRAGAWRREEGHAFPWRNIITRAVGTQKSVEVDTLVDEPVAGDIYLICSDGLHGVVLDSQIEAVLRRQRDLTRAVSLLISLALAGGGPDNVTAVLVRVVATSAR
jgi:protein phosphatase